MQKPQNSGTILQRSRTKHPRTEERKQRRVSKILTLHFQKFDILIKTIEGNAFIYRAADIASGYTGRS